MVGMVGHSSVPLMICFWCICPRTGIWRYGLFNEEGCQKTVFIETTLREGSDLKRDIEQALDTEKAELDFVVNVERLGRWSSTGWLARTNYAYCQIDLSKFAIERDVRQLPQLEFHDLETLKYHTGLPGPRTFDLRLLGELALIAEFPPTIEQ